VSFGAQFQTASAESSPKPAPYVPDKKIVRSSFRDNRRVLILGAGLVLLFLFMAFTGMNKKPVSTAKGPRIPSRETAARESESAESLTPIVEIPHSASEPESAELVDAEKIAHTVKPKAAAPITKTLASVPAFDQGWKPPTFSGSANSSRTSNPVTVESKVEAVRLEKPSLIFVVNGSPPETAIPGLSGSERELQVPIGTRLRARLESALNTAAATPATAVVEFNYERDGEILVPAGAVLSGRVESADRSGLLQIHFDSITEDRGRSLKIQAIATDLQLRPLRGRVEGKHEGRSLLVRSVAGVGEVAATVVGRGALNQPLSEQDLLRERLSNNVGQVGDQQLSAVSVSQHLSVSLPAGTEIYVIFQQQAKVTAQVANAGLRSSEVPGREELRQLLQLQQELSKPVQSEDKNDPQ
jgi:hypothetical protein